LTHRETFFDVDATNPSVSIEEFALYRIDAAKSSRSGA
jgi:hypothetical protein